MLRDNEFTYGAKSIMSKVYIIKFTGATPTKDVNAFSRRLLERIVSEENIKLEQEIPLKVHFGEKGNITFLQPENYNGIIDFLEEKKIKTLFIETSVMYGGQRHNRSLHLKTAEEHGFTRIPIMIADGEQGEDYYEVEINKKHFAKCKLGKEFSRYEQVLVLSHFKGHLLAGFGGAIKQLAMGFASKGGKLAQHLGIKPQIKNSKCKKCHLCEQRCAVHAITIGAKSFIDHKKCVGCGACVSICPQQAVSIFSMKALMRMIGTLGNPFQEKVVEYAYAAQKGKRNIYVNFAMNITAGCDCEPKKMKALINDIGILVSTDPVAIDQACFDLAKQSGKRFRGRHVLEYAEEIGLGSRKYELV